MALGLSRMQPRTARPPITPPAESTSNLTQEQDWLAQRGAILFEATCDLIGGFPGFADLGGEIADAVARISERFLVVDEGKPHGFGIPVTWLDGAVLAPQPERDEPELRVFFSDGASTRCFSIRFRPNRLAMRGGKRAERAQDALRAAGLVDAAPQALPEFTLPWERTREHDAEDVLWAGHASAPERVGRELAPSEIWLSTESLIWGSSEGNGLNRVALGQLSDVSVARLKDRTGTPAVYLAVAGDDFGRYEIPFVFDQQETPDRNFRERGAFLESIRSRAIPEGVTTPLWQPWRLDVHPATRIAEAELFETVPVIAPPSPEPVEVPGVRARLESWLPKLHAFANRGLSLPTVEDDKATVVAFESEEPGAGLEPESSVALGLVETGEIAEEEAVEAVYEDAFFPEVDGADDAAASPDECAPETEHSADVDEVAHAAEPDTTLHPEATDRFAEETVLSEPETAFVLILPQDREELPAAALETDETIDSAPDALNAEPTLSLEIPTDLLSGSAAAATVDQAALTPVIAVASDVDTPDPSQAFHGDETVAEHRYVPVSAAQRFETAALGVVADALQMIDIRLETGSLEPLSRGHSLSADRDAAFAEIRALAAAKCIKKRAMREQIERLTNLHDAGIRLRSLVELYDRGHLNNPELEQLRSKLVANVVLSPLVVPLRAADSETVRRAETFFGM